jgi:hypothetical protein
MSVLYLIYNQNSTVIMKVIISQSNYIPWKGYFDNIASSDVFVVYDDMQYTKRDWRNRNYIKTEQGLKWLTIPVEVSGKYFQKINETKISDKTWNLSHWGMLESTYKKAPYFNKYGPWIKELYFTATSEFLTEINIHFLKAFCEFLEIKTIFKDSREFKLAEGKTEKLVQICKELKATEYFTGPAAKNYMDETIFENEKIKIHYFDYSGYKEYTQIHPPFTHGVSIIDLIFHTGSEASKYLKFRQES